MRNSDVFILKVRETLSRRLRATQIWARWKPWLGKKDKYGNGGGNSDDRTRMELLMPQSTSGVVSFVLL